MRYKTEDEFAKAVRAGNLPDAVFLYGTEPYLVDLWKKKLSAPFEGAGAFGMQRFDGRKTDCEAVYDAVQSVAFMGGKKCVLVDDLDASKLSAGDLEILEEILGDPSPDCLFILTGKDAFDPKSAGGKKLLKAAEAHGAVVELSLRGQAGLVEFIKRTAARSGCQLTPDIAKLILSTCENDMNSLKAETEKICAAAGYGAVSREHVEAVASPRTEVRIFDLGKMIQAGNAARALDILSDLFYTGEQPVAILSTLIFTWMDLYRARVARESGVSVQEVVERFGYKGREFRIRNAYGSALTLGQLRKSLEILYECDRKLKSTGIDDNIAVEQAVMELLMAGAAG